MNGLVRKIINAEEYYIYHVRGMKNEKKKINDSRRKKIRENTKLSKIQKKEIDEYYKKYYGKKIPYKWHQHYFACSGKFDKRYFPELIYIPEYEWVFNSKEYTSCIEDKNITPLLAKGIEKLVTPETIISCACGVFRNNEYKVISLETAIKMLDNCDKVFIKPTINSGSGVGCKIIDIKNEKDIISGNDVQEILSQYNGNFVVQKCISVLPSIKKLHPESVNTFRVITYRMPNGRIFHMPTIMRMGVGDNFLDNAHAGGIFVGIDDNGYLLDKAYTEFKQIYTEHPDTHVKFNGYCIPQIKLVYEKAIEMHGRVPQLAIVNWDFTIDENENVVLIEANTRGGSVWLPQIAWGKGCFEENTEEILMLMNKKRKEYPFRYK